MKVLLIGNGAREHAIAKSIVKDGGTLYSFMSKENPGIADLSEKFVLAPLNDFEKLVQLSDVDYAIVGPEQPLGDGIVDYLEDHLSIPTFGPRKNLARIETSKVWARELMTKYSIDGKPEYFICKNIEDFNTVIKELWPNVVLKPDGLTGGKGVKVYGDHFQTLEEAENYAIHLLQKDGQFLIEEKLSGKEFSLQIYTDGIRFSIMPLVRDYKRAYDGDKGPNTGSMGSYSLSGHTLPFLSSSDISKAVKILKQTLEALHSETGDYYKGILYGQFMKTESDIYLIEYNVRFGDPEALNVLVLQETGFNKVALSALDKNLKEVKFEDKATTCVYLVPEGYPIAPKTDEPITVHPEIKSEQLFYASVYRKNGKIYTTKSRSLAIVAKEKELEQAKEKAYTLVPKIEGRLYYRQDIGSLI